MHRKKRRLGNFLIVLGVLCLAGAMGLFLYNRAEDEKAGTAAGAVLSELKVETASGDYVNPYDTAMTEVEIDGHLYIGYVRIPMLGLELPVMSEWSYPNLKISPCRYTGSAKTNDLVICAHNYARHFGNIKNLSEGDDVYFTDMDGVTTHYNVAQVNILQPTAVSEMTDSGYALTLFTCTYGGRTRVTVRCVEAQ